MSTGKRIFVAFILCGLTGFLASFTIGPVDKLTQVFLGGVITTIVMLWPTRK